jgi:hypothetical protein
MFAAPPRHSLAHKGEAHGSHTLDIKAQGITTLIKAYWNVSRTAVESCVVANRLSWRADSNWIAYQAIALLLRFRKANCKSHWPRACLSGLAETACI